MNLFSFPNIFYNGGVVPRWRHGGFTTAPRQSSSVYINRWRYWGKIQGSFTESNTGRKGFISGDNCTLHVFDILANTDHF